MNTMAEGSWTQLRTQLAQTDLALVPVGASEVYGPHIPNGTDGMAALAVARAVGREVPALITPLVPVGCSGHLMDFPGTLSVPSAALKAYLEGILLSLIRHGVRRLLVINGHAGNVAVVSELLYELHERYGATCAQIDLWRFIQPLSEDLVQDTDHPFGHAGEAITSMMLHLEPHLIRMSEAPRTLPTRNGVFFGMSLARPYHLTSETGVVGDATLATAAKGATIFTRTVRRVVEFVEGEAFANKGNEA